MFLFDVTRNCMPVVTEVIMDALRTVVGMPRHSVLTDVAASPCQGDLAPDDAGMLRSASKRISAKDGSMILARYALKPGSQDDDVNGMCSRECACGVIMFCVGIDSNCYYLYYIILSVFPMTSLSAQV
jgi:hypothetical protein